METPVMPCGFEGIFDMQRVIPRLSAGAMQGQGGIRVITQLMMPPGPARCLSGVILTR